MASLMDELERSEFETLDPDIPAEDVYRLVADDPWNRLQGLEEVSSCTTVQTCD